MPPFFLWTGKAAGPSTVFAPKSNLEHWAWKAPLRPTLPATHDNRRPSTTIDRFITTQVALGNIFLKKPDILLAGLTLIKALFCIYGKRHGHARAGTQHFGYRRDLRIPPSASRVEPHTVESRVV